MPVTQSQGGKAIFVDWAKEVRPDAHIREDFIKGPFEVQRVPRSQEGCRVDKKVYWIRDKKGELHGIPRVLLEVVNEPV